MIRLIKNYVNIFCFLATELLVQLFLILSFLEQIQPNLVWFISVKCYINKETIANQLIDFYMDARLTWYGLTVRGTKTFLNLVFTFFLGKNTKLAILSFYNVPAYDT